MKTKLSGRLLIALLFSCAATGCSMIEPNITFGSRPGTVERTYPLETKSIMVDDLNLVYLEAGKGEDVLLLHGGVIPMNFIQSTLSGQMRRQILQSGALTVSDTWTYNIQELARQYHVVALDMPGFGGSDKPALKYETEVFVRYLDAFVQAKGLKNVAIIGHGLGGKVALAYALSAPDQVGKIVAVDSFGSEIGLSLHAEPIPRFIPSFMQKEKAALANITLPIKRQLLGGLGDLFNNALQHAMYKPTKDANPHTLYNVFASNQGQAGEFISAIAAFKAQYIGTSECKAETYAAHQALITARRHDLKSKLSQIQVPTLIIHGFYDPLVSAGEALYMKQLIADSELITYPLSAHYPMVEESEKFNEDVLAFLSGIAPAEKSETSTSEEATTEETTTEETSTEQPATEESATPPAPAKAKKEPKPFVIEEEE